MNGEDDAVTQARTSELTNPDYAATKEADPATTAAERMRSAIDEYVTGDLKSGAARLRAIYNGETSPKPVRQPRNDFESAT
jgi:hypothetical protein